MATPHDRLEAFADGELSAADADAFRDHLLECPRCRSGLEHLLQIDHRLAFAGLDPSASVARPRLPRARAIAIAAGAVALMGVAALIVFRVGPRGDAWLLAEPERRLDARVALAAADRHRPLTARQMGTQERPTRLALEALAQLERSGDRAGLAAAYLLRGDHASVEQGLSVLAELGDWPEIEIDRAAAHLALGDAAEALRHLDAAPEDGPAQWNRALALQALGLPQGAARAFQRVGDLGEPGWADEARRRAPELSAVAQASRERWEAARRAGEALATAGTPPPADVIADRPTVLRLYFYDAVRTRASAAEVRALLPVASELDRQAGGDVLARLVAKVAARDFARRAPLAADYARLRQGSVPRDQVAGLVDRFLASGEDDLLLGALVQADAVPAHLAVFTARAEATGDPWFQLLGLHERAKASLAQGDAPAARLALEEAARRCAATPLAYRCVGAELDLALVDAQLARIDEAKEHAGHAWREARAANDLGHQDAALGHLAQLARVEGDLPLARAYLEELLEHGRGHPEQERFVHQNLAHVALDALHFDRARAEIDQALASGQPLTLVGALALSDVARKRPSPADGGALERALGAAKDTATPGQRLLLEHALGRREIELDRARGRARLEEVIRGAEAGGLQEKDEDASRARAYSFTSLIMDEGKAGDWAAAARRFGQELGGALPERCVVAAAEDTERSLLVARGASGAWLGDFQGARARRLPAELTGFAGAAVLQALEGCDQVAVFARPPLLGRSGLLPPEIAWSYRLRAAAPPPPPAGRAIHLVVKDVALSTERARALGQLNTWSADFGAGEERRTLEGAEATPSRVLAAMREATEIDLVAHGVAGASSEAAALVLAPEDGGDVLTQVQLRTQKLQGAPLVVLAACQAGQAARVLHQPTSLPAAFIQAGARGVLAASVPIPDLEAASFFNAVRARIRAGTPPAAALQDERRAWFSAGKGRTWLEHVLMFE